MTEYFIHSTSFAAPFFSDEGTGFQEAETPKEALESFAAKYSHPCGLYAAACYESADAFHKNKPQLARWLCNHEREKARLTKELGCFSFLGHAPGRFEINGELHIVENPKQGAVLLSTPETFDLENL